MLEPADIKLEPVEVKQEYPDSTTGNPSKKKAGRPKKLKQEKITDHITVKKKRKVDRFNGMPEEEVIARLLPDHLAPNLDIVIVGINPGLYAAYIGHHYAGPGNHFWKCMYLSGLIPEPMNAMQDFKLLEYGIGFTNIVARTTKGSADLTRKEIKEGAQILTEKLLKYKPKIAVFNGKGIYEVFVGHKNFHFGKQPELLPGTETAVFVMPSSSARCSQLPRAVDKVPFYEALRKFKDHLNGKLPNLDLSEVTFEDVVLKTAVKKEVKEEGEEYPGEVGGMDQASGEQGLGQFTQGAYQMIPHDVQQLSQSQGFVSQSSSQNIPLSKTSPAGEGTLLPVQIKQEPVDPDCQEPQRTETQTTEPSTTGSTQQQTLNQSGSTNCTETISLGQLEVYKQEAGSSHNDSYLNNFLSSLHGLVNKVAIPGQATSTYGMVNQAGISKNGPVQFNDALREIVRDNGAEELESGPGMELTEQPSSSQPGPSKTAKASKPRKRKSKSAEESPSSLSQSLPDSPPDQQYFHPYSFPSYPSQFPGNQTQSPGDQQQVPGNQHSFHTLQPVPPFTSNSVHAGMPQEAYSNAFMPQTSYQSQIAYSYMASHPGFTQMLGNGHNMMGMSGFPPQHFDNSYSSNIRVSPPQGQNGTEVNMPIKQEKADS